MRHVCCTVAVLVFAASMAGCTPQFVNRTYPIGPKPKAAQKMIEQIHTDEIMQHKEAYTRDTPTGVPVPMMTIIEDEGIVIVRTTPHGHQLIREALEALQHQ